MYRAIWFDIWGVLELYGVTANFETIANIAGISVQNFREYYFQHNHRVNVHNMNYAEFLVEVASHFVDTNKDNIGNKIREKVQQSEMSRIQNQELIDFACRLKQADIKIWILSNATSIMKERIKRYGWYDIFDVIILSGDIGFQKPQKEAFLTLFSELWVSPDEAIFVDDTSKSLSTSWEIGYHPIQFQNNKQTVQEITECIPFFT